MLPLLKLFGKLLSSTEEDGPYLYNNKAQVLNPRSFWITSVLRISSSGVALGTFKIVSLTDASRGPLTVLQTWRRDLHAVCL